ncbi:hypothetical protein DSUL_60034 [Desulfovibrionales bacterium]
MTSIHLHSVDLIHILRRQWLTLTVYLILTVCATDNNARALLARITVSHLLLNPAQVSHSDC